MSARFEPRLVDEVRARTALVPLIGRTVALRPAGREHVACCPMHREKTPSFTVNERKGFWHCFGCSAHGDAIAWVQWRDGVGFADAVAALARDAGLLVPDGTGPSPPVRPCPVVPRQSEAEQAAERDGTIAKARALWAAAQPARGSLVETYLWSRGIDLGRLGGPPPTLRFAPALPYWATGPDRRPVCLGSWPAMVAAIADAGRKIVGVHLTWLARDGAGKARIIGPDGRPCAAKKMRGAPWGGAIRLAALPPPGPRAKLALGEGIETTLSAMAACAPLAGWAAGSLGNIAGRGDPMRPGPADPRRPGKRLVTEWPDLAAPGLVPPPGIGVLVVLEDGDNGDPANADQLYHRAYRRFRAQGVRVRRAFPGEGLDFNDLLNGDLLNGRAA